MTLKPSCQVSVVIPSGSNEVLVEKILDSLRLQENVSFEVILVYNPPPKKWPLFAPYGFPIRKLSCEKGVNRARNLGLENALADVVVFLDADCIPQRKDFLASYLNLFLKDSTLTMAGGPYLIPYNANPVTLSYHALQMRWIQKGLLDECGSCLHLLGGNLALRKSKLGSERFDSEMIFGGTEREFQLRLSLIGHRFQFLSNLGVLHASPVHLISLIKKAWAQGAGTRYADQKLRSHPKLQKIAIGSSKVSSELFFYLTVYQIAFELGMKENSFSVLSRLWRNFWQWPLRLISST